LPKFTSRDLRAHPWRAISFSAAAVAIMISEGRYLFGVLLFFIGFGIMKFFIQWLRRTIRHLDGDTEEESEVSSIDI